MNDERFPENLRETAWRRTLTPAEQVRLRSWLATHPGEAEDWQAESLLNEGLSRLPDVPVPNNFTAVVLERARLEAARPPARHSGFGAWWRRLTWAPQVGFVAAVLAIGLLSFKGVQQAERRQMAHSVTVISEVAAVPSPEMLKNFDAIRALNQAPAPDEDLLRLMQ